MRFDNFTRATCILYIDLVETLNFQLRCLAEKVASINNRKTVRANSLVTAHSFFFNRFISQKISEIHRVTKLRNCSFNQFALVVPRRASDRECAVLGSYEYSSEKQVQRKNTAAVG